MDIGFYWFQQDMRASFDLFQQDMKASFDEFQRNMDAHYDLFQRNMDALFRKSLLLVIAMSATLIIGGAVINQRLNKIQETLQNRSAILKGLRTSLRAETEQDAPIIQAAMPFDQFRKELKESQNLFMGNLRRQEMGKMFPKDKLQVKPLGNMPKPVIIHHAK